MFHIRHLSFCSNSSANDDNTHMDIHLILDHAEKRNFAIDISISLVKADGTVCTAFSTKQNIANVNKWRWKKSATRENLFGSADKIVKDGALMIQVDVSEKVLIFKNFYKTKVFSWNLSASWTARGSPNN